MFDARALLDDILDAVDSEAYLTPSETVDPAQRAATQRIASAMAALDFDEDDVRDLIEGCAEAGLLDPVLRLSALHVLACHPKVQDWQAAARIAGEQEFVSLELGGPNLQRNLASVDRHRGVLAFLRAHYESALEHFTRALEREHTAENLGNVLCAWLRLGEIEEARELLARVRASFPEPIVRNLNLAIERDPDLAILREEEGA